MARLIRVKPESDPDIPRGAAALFVGNVRYANAAAKFWSSLIDEALDDFPNCSAIELAASSEGGLDEDLLYPQRALEKSLHRLEDCDLDCVIRETMAEMDLFGPPGPVRARLLAGEKPLFEGELPVECVDSEIFPYLLVWPLAWAGIPANAWNDELVGGDVSAEDRRRKLTYLMPFALVSKHISEGLFLRSILVNPSVTAIPPRSDTESRK